MCRALDCEVGELLTVS
ncbi:hypothetical protein [Microbacterium indicum]|nr:hypothetical protein [Microbacterium indicum]